MAQTARSVWTEPDKPVATIDLRRLGGGRPLTPQRLKSMQAFGGVKCVVFDMDGVIFERSNAWFDLVQTLNAETEAMRIVDRYLIKDYEFMAKRIAEEVLRGRPAAALDRLVAERKYSPGIDRLFDYLRQRQAYTMIVSTGPRALAERVRRDYGVDDVMANDVEVEDGIFTGGFEVQVRERRKSEALEPCLDAAMTARGFAFLNIAAIGDSASDRSLLRHAALGIAYGGRSPELREAAQIHLPAGGLGQLPDLLDRLGV
jgi:phosphoserine phosphatase